MTAALATKEKKTAQQLADMIGAHINLGGIFIKVHADPVHGWHPTVITTPGNVIRCQQMAEEAARGLRIKFDLKP
jgi:NADH:ubiquinone oxidoreductase subunit 2 (subunit N)